MWLIGIQYLIFWSFLDLAALKYGYVEYYHVSVSDRYVRIYEGCISLEYPRIKKNRDTYLAKTNSRRNRGRTIIDVDLEDRTGVTNNISNRHRRGSSNQTIINCDHYVNLEDSSSSTKENARKSSETPKDPVFNCPICIGPLIEPVSTKCGHIFCNNCIRAAITVQAKCPTCRKKITVRELIRVFLPSTS